MIMDLVRMQLERLKLFAELVNKGSFTRTADYLGISKAHVSKQIKALETELATQLIIRNTRTMRLTSAGENLFEHANKLTTFWHDSKQLLETSESSLTGEVHFTAPTGLLKDILLPIINQLCEEHPNISITAETSNQTYNLISTPYDFAVRITNTPPEAVIARKLTSFHYVCCASPEYLSLNGTPNTPQQLSEHTCIALSYWKNWQFKDENHSYEVNTLAKFQFSNNEVLKQAALLSMGICRIPSYMAIQEFKKDLLIPLFQEIESEEKRIYLLFPQSIKRPERVNLVMNAIKKKLSEL
jgi:DNA-binding transcriptional LysR family regulator